MDPESVNQFDRTGARAVELAAGPPAHFSSLLNASEITGTENRNQKENPFTQIPLQNL